MIYTESYSRSGRARAVPSWVKNMVPSALRSFRGLPAHLPRPPPHAPAQAVPAAAAQILVPELRAPSPVPPLITYHDSLPNRFGAFRRYLRFPQNDPEEDLELESFTDSAALMSSSSQALASTPASAGPATPSSVNPWAPYANTSTFLLMNWQNSGSHVKSQAEMDRLVNNVLLNPDFNRDELAGFDALRENRRTDHFITAGQDESPATDLAGDAWREGSVKLSMPKERYRWADQGGEDAAPTYEVKGIWYRPIVGLVKAAFQDVTARKFHWSPFTLLWNKPGAEKPERLYSEVYNTDTFLQEHEKLQSQPRNPTDSPDIEYVIAPLMFWSDSTHLANFGTASLWPIYALFGSLSKYFRCMPSAFAAHHLAYIPSVCPSRSS